MNHDNIELPDMTIRSSNDAKWQAAFNWYNSNLESNQTPLRMGCAPCWAKVYYALRRAKGL